MSEKKLQVWWIPQVPGNVFNVPVSSVEEGAKLLMVLSDYDAFQFENNIKPDYCNAGGLSQWDFEFGEWESWYDEDSNEDDPIAWLRAREGER